jgi:hypothetical protein
MSKSFLILATTSGEILDIDSAFPRAFPNKQWTFPPGCIYALSYGTIRPVETSRKGLISWSTMEGARSDRAQAVAKLGQALSDAGAADLRSLDMHVDELRRAQESWGKIPGPKQTNPYDEWLRTFVSGNAVMLHEYASEHEEVWGLIDSGASVHDWIDGPFYAATTILDTTHGRDDLYERDPARPWKWPGERDAAIAAVSESAFLSVLEVE